MTSIPEDQLDPMLDDLASSDGRVVFLTGAGISAESGIPTFRGEEGYWRVGSRNFRPMELATHSAFLQLPDDVWAWYLYRRSMCRAADPNAAHQALVELENALGDRFVLITQNVDGLHLRAGNTLQRTYQIHGNIDFMRCADGCTTDLLSLPETIGLEWEKGQAIGDGERELLRCGRCGARARPHVLWFDEVYDEKWFRFESSLHAAAEADLLVVIGTSGATNLPLQVGALVARRGAYMVVVNPEPSPFTEMAARSERGWFLQGTAGALVPPLVQPLIERLRQ